MGGRTRDEKMGKVPNVHALWAEMDRLEIILRPKRLKKRPAAHLLLFVYSGGGGEEEEGMYRAISSLGSSYQYDFCYVQKRICVK